MRVLHVLASFVAMLLGASAAMADPLAEFDGRWRAVEVVSDGIAVEPQDVVVDLTRVERGFRLRWFTPTRGIEEAAFEPGPSAGVYEVRNRGRSMLDIFSRPTTGNPLRGERLLWARVEDGMLVNYSLELESDGGFVLDRQAQTREDETMRLDFTRRGHEGIVTQFAARLERRTGR